ncbi:hypothetical protein [Methanonatronarchaeum sp. AMET-Sl]|uniref:hypothetical protein n=1 Tax=Methanonatronarchaeum sp. AMET-Sl TaxID=3037654 RepID=UPI00244D9FB4|nr:hypothetical protein [Methanonatronarchaeum sp. AMET-Sl]WGI18109.1 hypothetical protein QEN48_03655 [Methanonatronarchaeum sp. AMET-Sl]
MSKNHNSPIKEVLSLSYLSKELKEARVDRDKAKRFVGLSLLDRLVEVEINCNR